MRQGVKNIWRIGIPIVLSLALFLYFFHFLNKGELVEALTNASPYWIFIGIIFYFLQIVLKAYRFKFLFEAESKNLKQLIGIQGIQTVSNNILPAWLGEIIMPFLFKKIMNIGYAQSLSSIFVIRLVDFLISIFLFVFLFTFQSRKIVLLPFPVLYIQLIGVGALLAILSVCLIGRSETAYRKFMGLSFMKSWAICNRAGVFLGRIHLYFRGMVSFRSLFILLVSSTLIYTTLYFVFVSVCRAIHADLNYTEIFFVFVLIFPIELLPIRSFMNLGTYELGWVVALMMIGYARSDATLIAFGTHGVFIFYFSLTAVMILFLYRIAGRSIIAPAGAQSR